MLRFLIVLAAVLPVPWGFPAVTSTFAQTPLPPIEVFTPDPCIACIACIDWADHLRARGLTVKLVTAPDLAAVKRRLKVPAEVASRQTATVDGYFLEGHVPVEDILDLLKERPKARGLAVPGLPRGAPGLELSNPTCETACTMLDNDSGVRDIRRELFDTLLILPDGRTKVWARH